MEANEGAASETTRKDGQHIRWTHGMKTAFLDHLAGSCNITRAAAAIGVRGDAAHRLRRRDPAFAADWEDALASGYVVLETRLVGHVLAGHGRDVPVAGTDGDAIDVDQALRLLAEREVRRSGLRSRINGRTRLKRATPEETDAAILRKLRAIEAKTGA